jgi:hypothetical protein
MLPVIIIGTFPSVLDAEVAITHLRSPSHNYPDEVEGPTNEAGWYEAATPEELRAYNVRLQQQIKDLGHEPVM